MIDDERLCDGCCRAEECYKGMRPDEEAVVETDEYINKVDLLLSVAALPNEVSKKDILATIYDMPAVKYGADIANKMLTDAVWGWYCRLKNEGSF